MRTKSGLFEESWKKFVPLNCENILLLKSSETKCILRSDLYSRIKFETFTNPLRALAIPLCGPICERFPFVEVDGKFEFG